MNTIVLMGYLYLQPSDVPEFQAQIESLSAATQAEKGCLFYGLAVEHAATGRVLIAQQWATEEDFATHLAGPSAATFQQHWAHRVRVDVVGSQVTVQN